MEHPSDDDDVHERFMRHKLEMGRRAKRMLRLSAEMKLPGRAWLEFEVIPTDTGATIRQTALYDPVGLLGLLYWWAIYPLHVLVFRRMLRNLSRAAEAGAAP